MDIVSEDLNDIFNSNIEYTILKICQKGAIGTISDIHNWIQMYEDLASYIRHKIPGYIKNVDEKAIQNQINGLVSKNLLEDSGKGYNEYQYKKKLLMDTKDNISFKKNKRVAFPVIGSLRYSPLQLIRSRLESFLQYFKVATEDLADISIGVIEAAENAIKYGDGGIITVEYHLDDDDVFNILIKNPLKVEPIEDNIKTGKFSEGFTLMRGIMAINKLFDFFDIQRDDKLREVSFNAQKKLSIAC
jgi:anti-sigma regulatory factor (Ser/Thr protein kinase)